MAFLTQDDLKRLGFRSLGKDVRVSDRAAIYDHGLISLGDSARIDDFCVLSGKIEIGMHVHLAVQCVVAGGTEGVVFGDFSGLAYGCKVFTQSDDYSGQTMTNPTVPTEFKRETRSAIIIGRHSIVGAGAIILPGAHLGEGTSVGCASVVVKPTEPWGIYIGNPARRIKDRSRELLVHERSFLNRGQV